MNAPPILPSKADVVRIPSVRSDGDGASHDAGNARTPAGRVYGPEALPKRRGVRRAVWISLCIVALVGAGAGVGCVFWRTALVPHELVRRPPSIPDTGRVPAGVLAASAAPNAARGSADASADLPEERPPGSAMEARLVVPERSAVSGMYSQDPMISGAAAVAGADSAARAAQSGTEPAVEASGSPGRWHALSDGEGPAAADGDRSMTAAAGAGALDRRTHEAGPGNGGGPRSAEREGFSEHSEPDPAVPIVAPPAVQPSARTAARIRTTASDHTPSPFGHAVDAHHRASNGEPGIAITKHTRADRVADSLEAAYAALRAGDTGSASEAYRIVLAGEPGNRDALLGLAAVAAREGRWEEAAGHYRRVLAFDPADTVAQAALVAIDETDPTRGETRLKTLLWSEPRAAYLHFNLGNVYASQSRWPEAQESFFNAYRFDSGNADYAYNLAVSLDHLARRESARDFYREALALARTRPASFETGAVLARIRDMDSSLKTDAAPVPRASEIADTASTASSR